MRPLQAIVAPLAAFVAFAGAAEAATVGEAASAYRSNRVAEAEQLYGQVAADPAATPADRAEALRELGRIDWLIRGETDAAATALTQNGGDERCATLVIAARVFSEARAPAPVLTAAAQPRDACAPLVEERLHVGLARAHLVQAQLIPADSTAHLAAAATEINAIDATAQRRPQVASARLAIAIAQHDAAGALQAWKNYYWLDATDAPSALSMYAGRVSNVFSAGLAPNAAEPDRIALVDMLIRAGFLDEAKAVAGTMSDAPGWQRAKAYFTYRASVAAMMLRLNRAVATGQRASFERDYRNAVATLMRDAGLSGDSHAALAETYGIYGTDPGETSNYPSIHIGHLVQDDHMHVEQYGRSGEMRFVVIDNMISNGFESWLWDGSGQAGGWSSDGNLIVQVRTAYTNGPLTDLRRARPGPTRDAFLADIERRAIEERANLVRQGVAEIPSTGDRLKLQVLDQWAQRFGADDAAFMAEDGRATVQTSITAHEGRHALDAAARPKPPERDLEYRAKLSQIIFADYPRLGLASVATGAHNDTGHGRGNRMVLEGYRTWMMAHARDISGYDPNAPALAQLTLLTDEQIVAAARSLDPWANPRR